MDPNNLIGAQYVFPIQHLYGVEFFPGNCLLGQLTYPGYKQQINNGNGLRNRYIDYYGMLPDDTSGKTVNEILANIYLRADMEDRTQQSAVALFTGLYPNLNNLTNGNVDINIHSCDSDYEIIYPNSNVCPQLRTNQIRAKASLPWIERWAGVTVGILEQLNLFMYGNDLKTTMDELYAYDCGTVFGCHEYEMPAQYTQTLYEEVLSDVSWYYNYSNFYPDRINASRYSIGPLLKITMDVFDQYISTNSSSLFYLYSGHDTGPMMPMLGALNQYVEAWVPYASLITLELFQNKSSKEYFILASYNGNILQLPQPCDCDTNEYSMCSWDKFVNYMTPMIPTDSECPGMNPHNNVSVQSFSRKKGISLDRTVPFFIEPTKEQLENLFS